MKKGALIVSSFIAIVLSVALIVGSTFSLFTASEKVNISVQSGAVDVQAEIKDFSLYSVRPEAGGDLTDENGAAYKQYERSGDTFANGGKVKVASDGTISFENMSAGDKAEFNIDLKNNSTMRVMFNTRLSIVDQESNKLFDALDIGAEITGTELKAHPYDGKSIRTDWSPLTLGESGTVKVSIGLPVDTDIQGVSVKIKCAVAAVQANIENDGFYGIAAVTDSDGITHDYFDVDDAIANSENGAVIEILHGDDGSYLNRGPLTVDKELTITSADGESYEFNDLSFNVVEGGSLALRGLTFKGDCRVNLSSATSFTLDDCNIEAKPSVLFDEYNRQPLDRAAYVVATGEEQSGTQISIVNTRFSIENGAAIYLETALGGGSDISGNTFECEGYAVELKSIAANAEITVLNNTFNGAKAVSFAQKYLDGRFTAKFGGNSIICENAQNAVLANTEGSLGAAITDNGSAVNGNAVTLGAFTGDNKLFCGIGVSYDRVGLISGGTFRGVIAKEDFMELYVSRDYRDSEFIIYN